MGCHLVRIRSDARERVLHELRFRGVRRTHGEIDAYGAGGPTLCDARVDCQIGAPQRAGDECMRCPRLMSWTVDPSNREITLRCAWLHTDQVSDRMTGAGALVAVEPSRRCVEADRVAAREGVHRLLVVDERKVVGIVCRCDLETALSERVAAVMQREVYVIAARATLGEAAAAMSALGVGCLPVADEQRLVGILTRGDLFRAGLPEETFT